MTRALARPLAGEFARFVIVGLANTAVGLAVIYLLKWFAGFGDVTANLCGYAIGITTGFMLNRNWTFRDQAPILASFLPYLAAVGIGYAANLALVLALIEIAEKAPRVEPAVDFNRLDFVRILDFGPDGYVGPAAAAGTRGGP